MVWGLPVCQEGSLGEACCAGCELNVYDIVVFDLAFGMVHVFWRYVLTACEEGFICCRRWN